MLGALQLAFIDSVNLLLIGVIVAVGIAARRNYAKTTALLIAGDWCGVVLAYLRLPRGTITPTATITPINSRLIESTNANWMA